MRALCVPSVQRIARRQPSNGWLTRLLLVLLALLPECQAMAFDLQGHRGARGLVPENTLAGFAKALEIGVTTLEGDLCVTRDRVLVLSHDCRLNRDIVREPNGRWLSATGPAIFSLSLAELRRYDVGRIRPGSLYAVQFGSQTPADGQRIPTLEEVFALAKASGKRPRFNMETKLSPDSPSETPDPQSFAQLVVEAVRAAGLTDRFSIQSFDWRTLLAAKRMAPEIETVCLTSNSLIFGNLRGRFGRPSPWLAGLDLAQNGGSIPRLAKSAGCGTWSPSIDDVTAITVKEAHDLGLKVLPWTVNSRDMIERAIDMQVDGLITDYPDLAHAIVISRGMNVRPQ